MKIETTEIRESKKGTFYVQLKTIDNSAYVDTEELKKIKLPDGVQLVSDPLQPLRISLVGNMIAVFPQ